jgi:putative sigma-54 modulation protein
MKINFTARNTEITPDIRKYCERRLQSLERRLNDSIESDLILSVEKYRNKVEINMKARGMTLNSVEETQDMISSLNAAFDHIEKRIKKEREKLRERKRRKNRSLEERPLLEGDKQKKIIMSRDYSLKPMTIDEAVLQLESGRKDVFVFRKFESEKWTVVFRRKDGNFGLIEPE